MAQRGLIDSYMDDIVFAEQESDDELDDIPLTDADFLKAETAGLCDLKNLYIFIAWYQFAGPQRPPTIAELSELSASTLKDFSYLFTRLAKSRKRHGRKK